MKALKITEQNAAEIENALADVNGKAHAHTFTSYMEMAALAEVAEEKVVALVGAKARAPGSVCSAVSGGRVANSYKDSRIATSVIITRRATGWFLESISSTTIWQEGGGKPAIRLTKEQDAAAVEHFRKSYSIIKGAE